ncbi:MAG: primosomal protein N' [Clostridia bacterium]|nr:primosomal protein N' [Clostridia bacterium]
MFAKIIVDIANSNVDRLFTYSIPNELDVRPGHRVLVPFGRGNKPTEGFVIEVCPEYETDFPVKPLIRTMEPYTCLLEDQLELAKWIQKAYHCTLCDALRLMIPAQLRGSRVKEKTVRTVRIAEGLDAEAFRASLLKKDGCPRSPKQLEVFDLLVKTGAPMEVSDLSAYIPNAAAAVSALIKKGCLTEEGFVTFRDPFGNKVERDIPPELTKAQKSAVEAISEGDEGSVFLLHGVTGSGKTEVYLNAISRVLEEGGGAIVLVPEISLTPQTTDRFRRRFGDTVAVMHSHLGVGERYDEWRRLRLGKARVVVGARSAVFAPVENLKLIVIDEEHEPSYRSESKPEYSADETAIRRVRLSHGKLVLGSATPQLISYLRAKQGAYKLLSLPERINGIPMPNVEIVDMRREFASGNNGIFSRSLSEKLKQTIENGDQAILFLNRRGYSHHGECRACGFVFTCPHCDVAMTYHKFDDSLRCHYCGYSVRVPQKCPSCGSRYIKYTGIGTQQVEEQLKELIPGVRCLRMDTDTTGGKTSHRDILDEFTAGNADVLIGTQMVAKGLDIPNVTLVGVVFADSSLFHSDFRSGERTFQLLTQVAGRAGRAMREGSDSQGRVVIQTNAPEHRAVRLAAVHDYKSFFDLEIRDRAHTLFPPFAVFARALFECADEKRAAELASEFSEAAEKTIAETLKPHDAMNELLFIGWGPAPIRKRDDLFRYSVIIKLARTKHTSLAVNALWKLSDSNRTDGFRGVEINPTDLL